MNRHLDAGQLRAALDGELDVASLRHLEDCPSCRKRQTLIEVTAQAATGKDVTTADIKTAMQEAQDKMAAAG